MTRRRHGPWRTDAMTNDSQGQATPPQPSSDGPQPSAGSVIGAIAVGIIGLVSLLMTACFGFFGIAMVAMPSEYASTAFGCLLLIIGVVFAALTVFLLRLAFRLGSGRK